MVLNPDIFGLKLNRLHGLIAFASLVSLPLSTIHARADIPEQRGEVHRWI